MTVRRMIAATALATGVLVSGSGVASAQSPQQVLPTEVVQVQGTQLTVTGQDSVPMVIVGGGLAAAGAALVVVARRRRATLEVS
jgi:LPXTG-motif cell wall-anchored protein